jgi:excisionase family DNA binding protein
MKRQTAQPAEGDIMTLQDAADYLNCSDVTVQRLVTKRAIPAFRFGRAWRFRRSDLGKWIKDRTVVASQAELGTLSANYLTL